MSLLAVARCLTLDVKSLTTTIMGDWGRPLAMFISHPCHLRSECFTGLGFETHISFKS